MRQGPFVRRWGLLAGPFGLATGAARPPWTSYYIIDIIDRSNAIIDRSNPAGHGMDGAVRSHVEYLHEVARAG